MTLFVLLGFLLAALAPQTFNILGSVRDNGGQPVSSIRISVVDENYTPLRTVFTDNSGRFRLTGLSSGRYVLRVEVTGTPFEEQSVQLDLQALRIRRGGGSEPYPVEIVLKRKKEEKEADGDRLVFAQTVPEAARVEYERGASNFRDNKPELAVVSLKKALELFPDYFQALELLGTEYVKRGDYDPAVPILSHALQINRTAKRSLYALGVAYLKLNRAGEAVEWLKRCSEIDSNNPNVFMMLGIAFGNNQDLSEAEAALKKAYELGKSLAADAHLYLAGIYSKQEKYDDAIRELELYLKESKDIKNTAPIKEMISKLKEKKKASSRPK
jgi:tetratricopeptide (TPR) repeat protein